MIWACHHNELIRSPLLSVIEVLSWPQLFSEGPLEGKLARPLSGMAKGRNEFLV
jgi:hypothetical protein